MVGRTFVYRELWHGHVMSALPMILAGRTARRLVLYHPAGVSWCAARLPGAGDRWSSAALFATLARPDQWEFTPRPRGEQHSIFLYRPGAAYTVRLAWDATWSFQEWYVNFEAPWRRTPIGADSMDRFLDIVVTSDLRWTIKDADELAEAVRRGFVGAARADLIRRTAERIVARIERRLPPFGEPWPDWRPDPRWPVPALPARWDQVRPGQD